MSITFAYHSPDPENFKQIGNGANVGRIEVEHMSGGNDYMAAKGAERLELPPGRYVAIQESADRSDVILGWSWIIDVVAPKQSVAKVVRA